MRTSEKEGLRLTKLKLDLWDWGNPRFKSRPSELPMSRAWKRSKPWALRVLTPNLKPLHTHTHYIPSQNKGPYFKPNPNKEETGKGSKKGSMRAASSDRGGPLRRDQAKSPPQLVRGPKDHINIRILHTTVSGMPLAGLGPGNQNGQSSVSVVSVPPFIRSSGNQLAYDRGSVSKPLYICVCVDLYVRVCVCGCLCACLFVSFVIPVSIYLSHVAMHIRTYMCEGIYASVYVPSHLCVC